MGSSRVSELVHFEPVQRCSFVAIYLFYRSDTMGFSVSRCGHLQDSGSVLRHVHGFLPNQYITAAVTPRALLHSQSKAVFDDVVSSMINHLLANVDMLHGLMHSNGLFSALLTNYRLTLEEDYLFDGVLLAKPKCIL